MRSAVFMALVAASAGSLVQVHEPSMIPNGWRATSEKVSAEGRFPVTVGVKRSNKAALDRIFEEVSNPQSENYLQYPSYEEIGDIVRPSAEHTRIVKEWLSSNGVEVTRVHPHGDYIHAEATVAQIQKMANGEFMTYEHTSGAKIWRLTSGVRVPAVVAAAIDTFAGFHGFPLNPIVVDKKLKEKLQAAGKVDPAVFRKTYNVTAVPKTGKQNIQAIAQFQGQYVDDKDLADFCTKYDAGSDCKISKYIGKNEQQPGIESMLDTEYIMSLSNTAETWVYSYPNFDFCADLGTFGSDVTGESTFPYSISISYGSQKIDYCSKTITTRLSDDIQKMGTMGITVMISSGDDGSGGETRQGSNGGKLSPSFPASIPTCIAVGSTYWLEGTTGEQQATTQFGSGGGFSYDFPVPSFQAQQVQSYLSNVKKPNSQYATGRGTPDVSTLGESFTVVEGGSAIAVGGTSCSSPSFAGLVTLLNEACIAESGKTLGYANPLFYQNPKMFTDITKGTNAIGENRAAGWEAIKGWDASTGLGTPNFGLMLGVVKNACKNAARK
eukprot:TRINITY_DN182_c0_g1_i2.p1 TRINITY_DN182_c0_g1~~TRINITY_DN182_c0_g1_i2.p1  ORF type:complete len:552 (+),score=200.94 TRINITY_DN182_c0_g1_i2:50-1705(+)